MPMPHIFTCLVNVWAGLSIFHPSRDCKVLLEVLQSFHHKAN
uniref:Uncharacterized protein n=1 Tax=Arundo donax TaxID=35708 RepID=A0A0A9E632_ARUDO